MQSTEIFAYFLLTFVFYAELWQHTTLNDRFDCFTHKWCSECEKTTKHLAKTLGSWTNCSAFGKREATTILRKLLKECPWNRIRRCISWLRVDGNNRLITSCHKEKHICFTKNFIAGACGPVWERAAPWPQKNVAKVSIISDSFKATDVRIVRLTGMTHQVICMASNLVSQWLNPSVCSCVTHTPSVGIANLAYVACMMHCRKLLTFESVAVLLDVFYDRQGRWVSTILWSVAAARIIANCTFILKPNGCHAKERRERKWKTRKNE